MAGLTGGRVNRFNILKQSKDYDPEGAYARLWLPELARVGAPLVFEPWRLSPAQQAAAGVAVAGDGSGGSGGGGGPASYPTPLPRPGSCQAFFGTGKGNGGGAGKGQKGGGGGGGKGEGSKKSGGGGRGYKIPGALEAVQPVKPGGSLSIQAEGTVTAGGGTSLGVVSGGGGGGRRKLRGSRVQNDYLRGAGGGN